MKNRFFFTGRAFTLIVIGGLFNLMFIMIALIIVKANSVPMLVC